MDAILDPWLAGALLAGFSVLWVFLGWLLGRNANELDDYMLAGRRGGLAPGTATAMAAWVTGNTTLVAPQLAFQRGSGG
ncbi:MAG: urea transporter, partial [Planctomycetes bacterium]|nr:urea transporter [Planctomycetota bacterium]